MSTRRTIDVQDGDKDWVNQFECDIDMICGLIEESFETNKAILLSPVLRELIRDRGRALKTKLSKVRHRLCVDNPGDPLSKGGDA